MTDQPPAQPPVQPPEPSGQPMPPPGLANPATQPMPAASNTPTAAQPAPTQAGPTPTPTAPAGPPSAGPPSAGQTPNAWHQATSTPGGRWAIAIAAGALVCLMLLGVVGAGLLVLRNHDRFAMMGQRTNGSSHGQMGQRGQGYGRGPGGNNGFRPLAPGVPDAPGQPGSGTQGLGGLGGVLGGGALHGTLTATVNGSPQVLAFQRGQVSAVSTTSITLKSSDGFVGTYGRTSATITMMAAPVTGGQAFVVAQASDKVAIRIIGMPAAGGVGPSS